MSFDMNPADEDPHGECRHEIHRLQQENAILSSGVTCFGCGATYSPDIANGQCDSAHRETWPHEWINQRTRDTIAKNCEYTHEIQRLNAELESLKAYTLACRKALNAGQGLISVYGDYAEGFDNEEELAELDAAMKERHEAVTALVQMPIPDGLA